MKLFYLLFMTITLLAFDIIAEDKAFKRKDITDTKKKLKIRNGSITDTKKLLRKTDTLSRTQISRLKMDSITSIGKEAYIYASKNTPHLLQTRFKYAWLKMQLEDQDKSWKEREKRDAFRSGGKLTETRAKDYEKKYSKNNVKIYKYKRAIEALDNRMIKTSKSVSDSNGEFFENSVGENGARLTDSFGNFIANLAKGKKVQTKHSKLDHRYYEVKYNNRIVFTLKSYFIQ